MVVPIERMSRPLRKQYVGNNLTLNIESNKSALVLTGNNCKVKLEENSGSVKVVGDHCELMVLRGDGNIKYIGNFGKIRLGLGISSENVSYVGNEGYISSVGSDEDNKNREKNQDCNYTRTCDITVKKEKLEAKSAMKNVSISNCNKIRVKSPCISKNFQVSLTPANRKN